MTTPQTDTRILTHYGYLTTLVFLTLSGFGQMPIFKRYYIADIPGFGWLAKFFVTHHIHYLGAILILALFAYTVTQYLMMNRRTRTITVSGYVRGGLLTGIVATGILLVIRNLEGVYLSHGFIIFLDVAHLGMVMAFIGAAAYCLITKKSWTQPR